MIREVDVDGDGGIDFQEFIKLNVECVDVKRLIVEGEVDFYIEEVF